MILHEARKRPLSWAARRAHARRRWLLPLLAVDFFWEWLAYALSHWSFIEVLEYLGSFSVLIGVIFWFSESGDRVMQRHYQAWQVINTAQGKGGSGGRIEALQELNDDRVPLIGVDASLAFLQGLHVPGARLARSSFAAADLRNSDLRSADLTWADLHDANLRFANLDHVAFDHANLQDSDLTGADLAAATLDATDLTNADLRNADLRDVRWQHIGTIRNANVAGVRNPPAGFLAWALAEGAVRNSSEP